MKKLWNKTKRVLRGLFFSEIMVGGTGTPPMNRKQRRAQASIDRKSKRRNT
jgi:hypothetical protein